MAARSFAVLDAAASMDNTTICCLAACCNCKSLAHAACLTLLLFAAAHCVAYCLQGESGERQQQLRECQQQLSSLQERHSRQTLELEAQLREQAAAAQQDKLNQVAAVRAQLER
jgi:uncharacterized protein HemX